MPLTNLPYQNFIKKLDPAKARQKIDSLRHKVLSIMARAQRSARRHDDCGPLDMVYERVNFLETQIEVLEWFELHGTLNPPKDMAHKLDELLEAQAERSVQKKNHAVIKEEFPNIVGQCIHWNSKRQGKKAMGIVVSQRFGRRGLVYRTAEGWRVPHPLVTSVSKAPRGDTTLVDIAKKQRKIESVLPDLLGKSVKWTSRKLGNPQGIVTQVKRKKVSVDVGGGQIWRVPITILTEVDGKKFSV